MDAVATHMTACSKALYQMQQVSTGMHARSLSQPQAQPVTLQSVAGAETAQLYKDLGNPKKTKFTWILRNKQQAEIWQALIDACR